MIIEKKLKNGILQITPYSFEKQQKFMALIAKKTNELKIDITNETSILALFLDEEIQNFVHKYLMPPCLYNSKPIKYPDDFEFFDTLNKGYTEESKPHSIKLQEDYLEIFKEIFEVILPLYMKMKKIN